jgi:hypothetical protein
MANSERKIQLEVESLENRLVPTISSVQLAGGVIQIQGLDTPNLVHVFARGNKVEVELTDLSTGLHTTESFKKDKVHNVQFHESTGDKDVFIDDFHGKHVESQEFNHEGTELSDDNPGGGESGGGGGGGSGGSGGGHGGHG